jgi:hypothetical protein
LIDERQHSCVVDFQCFRRDDCHTDHYPIVEIVRERLLVSKRAVLNFHVGRFHLKKPNIVKVKEYNQVEVSTRFVVLDDG